MRRSRREQNDLKDRIRSMHMAESDTSSTGIADSHHDVNHAAVDTDG